ncbi:MAG: metallophosphatase domain-containing protein [Deltaproteobacteria bacterium]|nr:metallophosphatase domain-containing protein [Deltaproteobacteria bacterium]
MSIRIVAVADTHLFTDDLESLPSGDILVHAGDLCRHGNLMELAEAAEWLQSLPYAHKVVVAGNHDWSFFRNPREARALLGDSVTYLEDSEATILGVRFYGSPWQPAFGDWAFNLPRGKPLAEKWAKIPEGVDVLVTHGPPHRIGDRTRSSEREGCEDLAARVRELRPLAHLFGHIHEDGGLWEREGTTYANVTSWECERSPTVIDLDLVRRQVTPVVVPPAR